MEVWVDPATKRIKAIYDGCSSNSQVWAEQGYEKYDRIEAWMSPIEELPPSPREFSTIEKILVEKGIITEAEIRAKE